MLHLAAPKVRTPLKSPAEAGRSKVRTFLSGHGLRGINKFPFPSCREVFRKFLRGHGRTDSQGFAGFAGGGIWRESKCGSSGPRPQTEQQAGGQVLRGCASSLSFFRGLFRWMKKQGVSVRVEGQILGRDQTVGPDSGIGYESVAECRETVAERIFHTLERPACSVVDLKTCLGKNLRRGRANSSQILKVPLDISSNPIVLLGCLVEEDGLYPFCKAHSDPDDSCAPGYHGAAQHAYGIASRLEQVFSGGPAEPEPGNHLFQRWCDWSKKHGWTRGRRSKTETIARRSTTPSPRVD